MASVDGWMLEKDDRVKGPVTLESLQLALSKDHGPADYKLMHPQDTLGEWISTDRFKMLLASTSKPTKTAAEARRSVKNQKEVARRSGRKDWIAALLLSIVGVPLMIVVFCGDAGNEADIEAAAKDAVLSVLKAPKTAIFDEVVTVEESAEKFIVAGKISAVNSFGALLTNEFTAEVSTSNEQSNFVVTDLKIEHR